MKTSSLPVDPDTPSTVSAVTLDEISDPTAIGHTIEVIEQDVVQLGSSPLRVRRVVVRLGTSVVLFQSTNLPVCTRTKLQDGFVAYVLFGPGAVGTLNGLPVGPDRLLASRSGIEVEFVVEAGYESVAFLVPPKDIRAHIQGRHGEDEFHLPHGFELLTPSPSAVHRLYRWGRRLIDMAARRSRKKRFGGASGTSAIFREPTRTALANCHPTPCDGRLLLRNNLKYPKDADFLKTYGPRLIIHSFAGGKIQDLGPLTKKHTAEFPSIPDKHVRVSRNA